MKISANLMFYILKMDLNCGISTQRFSTNQKGLASSLYGNHLERTISDLIVSVPHSRHRSEISITDPMQLILWDQDIF